MPSSLLNELGGIGDRYFVRYESKTGAWRILDLQHAEVKKFQDLEIKGLDAEIPDDSPAVILIPQLAFTRLIAEAVNQGILDPPSLTPHQKDKLVEENEGLKAKILALEVNAKPAAAPEPPRSDAFTIKKDIVDKLYKLAMSESINDI